MKTNHEIRKINYDLLVTKFREDEEKRGINSNGGLKRFAEFTELSPAYLSHIKNGRKNIGTNIARQLERAFKRSNGWLDVLHGQEKDEPQIEVNSSLQSVFVEIEKLWPDEVREMMVSLISEKLGCAIIQSVAKS